MEKVIPIKVAVRIRPLNEKEIGGGCKAALEDLRFSLHLLIKNTDPVKAFTYDFSFGQDSSNEELYEGAVKTVVKNEGRKTS